MCKVVRRGLLYLCTLKMGTVCSTEKLVPVDQIVRCPISEAGMFVVTAMRTSSVMCVDSNGFYSVCGLVICAAHVHAFLDCTEI